MSSLTPKTYVMALTAQEIERRLLSIDNFLPKDVIRQSLVSPAADTVPSTQCVVDALQPIQNSLNGLGSLADNDNVALDSNETTGVLPTSKGGTGGANVSEAQQNLGILTQSEIQNLINNSIPTIQEVDLGSSQVKNILPISKGGTGSTSASGARVNLGVWSASKSEILRTDTFEALKRTYAEAGFNLVPGSFETGGTVYTTTDVLLYEADGHAYRWDGALPKLVTTGSTPNPIGSGGWVSVDSKSLRGDLTAAGGAGLIGGLAKPVTWTGFAGGADPTGATPSDAAFSAASVSTAYVPEGTYQLTSDTPNGAWIVSSGASFTGVGKLKGGLLKIGKNVTDYGGNPGRRWVNDSNPANIHRFNDRLFAGGSAKNNGLPLSAPGATSSWIDDPSVTGILAGSLEQNAMAIAAVSDKGFNGIVTGVRASDAPFGASLGHTSLALQDRATADAQAAWSGYFVGIKTPAAHSSNGVNNVELNLWNQKSDADAGPIDPYNFFPVSNMNNLWLSNGFPEVEVSRPSYRATCAIGILNNVADNTKAKYRVGIAFKSTSLEGCDGVTGRGIAMALARGHSMQWYYGAGNAGPYITSNVDSDANGVQNMVFDNFGLLVRDTASGATQLRVEAKANPVNYPRLSPSTTGQDVVVAADGGDSNINLRLMAKGTGNVLIGASLRPNSANSYTVGTSSSPFAGGFTQVAFTVTSDENYKTKPLEITDEMLDAAAEVDWCMFQYLDRVEAKGEDLARWHFGAMAQRFVEAFERHGLNAHDYAFICYDEWGDQYIQVQINEGEMVKASRTVDRPVMVEIDGEMRPKLVQVYCVDPDDGEPIFNEDGTRKTKLEVVMESVVEEYDTPADPVYEDVLEVAAGSRYGIRYDQAIILKQKQIERDHKRQIDALIKRIEKLERMKG